MQSFVFVLFTVLFKRFGVSVASKDETSPCSIIAHGDAKQIAVGFNCSYPSLTMAVLESNGTRWCQVTYNKSKSCGGGASCSCKPYRPNSMTNITMPRNLSADFSGPCIVLTLMLNNEMGSLHNKTFVVEGNEDVTYNEDKDQCNISTKTDGFNKREPQTHTKTVLLVFAVIIFVIVVTVFFLQWRLKGFLCANRTRKTRCCAFRPLQHSADSHKSLASAHMKGSTDSMILFIGGFSRCSNASESDVDAASRPPTAATAVEYSEPLSDVNLTPDVTNAVAQGSTPRGSSATQKFQFTDSSCDYSEACDAVGLTERGSNLSDFASDPSLRPPMPPPV